MQSVYHNPFFLLRKYKVHTNSIKQLNRKRDLFNVFLFDWFILKVPCKHFGTKTISTNDFPLSVLHLYNNSIV